MSFNEIERSIRDLKDVTEAPKMREKVKELEEELSRKENRHRLEIRENEKEVYALRLVVAGKNLRIKELENIRTKYKKKSYSPKEFKALVRAEVGEYIEKNIRDRAKKLAEKQLPHYIAVEISRYPNDCSAATRRIIEEQARFQRDTLLMNPSTWPPWFNAKVQAQVDTLTNHLIDKEFENRVNTQAWNRLNDLVNYHWPKQLTDKLTPFIQSSIRAQLLTLTTTFQFQCWKCGTPQMTTMTPNNLAIQIQKGKIVINCVHCHRRIRITLGELLWIIINNGDIGPPPRILQYGVKYLPAKSLDNEEENK